MSSKKNAPPAYAELSFESQLQCEAVLYMIASALIQKTTVTQKNAELIYECRRPDVAVAVLDELKSFAAVPEYLDAGRDRPPFRLHIRVPDCRNMHMCVKLWCKRNAKMFKRRGFDKIEF